MCQKIKVLTITIIPVLFFMPVFMYPAYGEKPQKELSVDERFHSKTSLTWRSVIGDVLRFKPERPPEFKTYPESPRIKLPEPTYRGMTIEEAIQKRRSVRNYSPDPLSLVQLSQLLFAAQGITGKMYGQPLRTAPSAGALYPFETYL
jgi:hypothetical protein